MTSTPGIYDPEYLYTNNMIYFQINDNNQIPFIQQRAQPPILLNNSPNIHLVGPPQNHSLVNQNNILYISPASTGWVDNTQPLIMSEIPFQSQATNVNPSHEYVYPTNNQNQMIINIQNDQSYVHQNEAKSIFCGNLKNNQLIYSRRHEVVPSMEKNTLLNNEGKLYICQYDGCGVSIKRKDDLKRHMRKHTGIKPFTCIDCEKKFSRKDHFHSHRRTHTNERPFKCEKCPSTFKRSDERNRHMKRYNKLCRGDEYETTMGQANKTFK
ncbi:Early growth response protein 1 [Thelohanellus kitauei]|uniref:Early growth response protein 1 n=1 Tax=Thelohanellus kitauei TaxID=669202 RepID=A0A0C2J9F9_THEKT|nr:Early growth response protein 1 [Thelohanellus kitauei]KII75030.1 Early growth response protein 1 [Thelohanellus kitauei]